MKLNNRGFAISTVIYGLAIMGILLVAIIMATMAATRSNSRQLAKSIEEELNRFNKSETFFGTKGDSNPLSQEYIVPVSGWYRIELWGSSGGSGSNGAYTSGIIELEEGNLLYFYVGKAGSGKETDVRVVPGQYNDAYSASSRIMVAAGGGSAKNAPGGTLYGYHKNMISIGGKINSNPDGDFNLIATGNDNPTNGTLVGFPKDYSESIKISNTNRSVTYQGLQNKVIPKVDNGSGGDGYYPSEYSEIGGTSYIAGYAGCNGLSESNGNLVVSANPKAIVYNQEYNTTVDDGGDVKYGSKLGEYYFVDGIMLANVNDGKGRAKIERIAVKTTGGQKLNRKNSILTSRITAIKDCVDPSSPVATKISAISRGNELGGTPTTSPDENGLKCRSVSLDSEVDEIAIWHKSGVDIKREVIKVNVSGKGWQTLRNSNGISETETVTGIRISAYQPNAAEEIPKTGDYYIMPVLSENKIVSAAKTAVDVKALEIEKPNGYKRQRWTIERIYDNNGVDSGEYKIYDLARYNAMQIIEDENKLENKIGADTPFNKNAKDETQYWTIVPVGDGTYIIKTRLESIEGNTGYITAQTNRDITENLDRLEIGKNNNSTARFKLISVNYSSS